MKLLFDENLSRKSPERLQDLFPDSIHVAHIGYKSSADELIAAYAVANGYVVVTKDHDLQEIALSSQPLLKVVLLQVGNMSANNVESLLRRHFDEVQSLGLPNSSLRILIIDDPR